MNDAAEISKLEGYVLRLREALQCLGSHAPNCKDNVLRYGPDAHCTCGLEKVLDETEL